MNLHNVRIGECLCKIGSHSVRSGEMVCEMNLHTP